MLNIIDHIMGFIFSLAIAIALFGIVVAVLCAMAVPAYLAWQDGEPLALVWGFTISGLCYSTLYMFLRFGK